MGWHHARTPWWHTGVQTSRHLSQLLPFCPAQLRYHGNGSIHWPGVGHWIPCRCLTNKEPGLSGLLANRIHCLVAVKRCSFDPGQCSHLCSPANNIFIYLMTYSIQEWDVAPVFTYKEERKGMFYLMTHSTHFIYNYMSEIWKTLQIVRGNLLLLLLLIIIFKNTNFFYYYYYYYYY